MNQPRVLVVGAGAVGGYFGGRLAQAGRDVTFLVREARARALRERGLEIVSPHGDARIEPRTVTVEALNTPSDLILLAVKTYALQSAIADITPAVGDNTAILPVLNGLIHMEKLIAAFGASRVLGGVCFVATTLDDQGRIVQLNDLQELVYGEVDGRRSTRIEAIDRAMQGAAFTARTSPDILLDMWEKWVFIAALGASTCLLRGSTADILAAPRGRDLIVSVLEECCDVSATYGYPVRAESLERSKTMLAGPNSNMTSSMYRDLQKGAPLEADAILGDMCKRGEAAGLKLPLLNAAFAQLSIYERKRMSSSDDLPDDLRTALDAYRKNATASSWTTLSQLPVNGMDVLDALQRIKPDFPDPLPLPVEDLVQDNEGFYEWPSLPDPDDVRRAIVEALATK